MTTHATADDHTHDPPDGEGFEPPIRRIFRDVVADRLPEDTMPPQAALLFTEHHDPHWTSDRFFLGDFYNVILHQDTCRASTAAGIPMLAALAIDDRVPARQRFDLVDLLFSAATAAERHQAASWPQTPRHADPDAESRSRAAVQAHVPELLARWSHECAAVRLALAALAVAFPTERTLPALTSRLRGFAGSFTDGTDIGDYIRFTLVLASQDPDRILHAVETLTDAYWKGTTRTAPLQGRAFHLLAQMLSRVDDNLRTYSAIAPGATRTRPIT
jgi:hypothetical protein